MKVKVQTKSGQFDFECEQGENLLYAGLRNGLTLPYECATGTCGTCRARVKDGEPRLVWTEAPGLKFVKKEKNELLMCRSVVQGDCTLRVPAEINQLPGNKTVPDYRKGKIRNIQALTHDVISFDIDIDIPMTYEAGQFVVIEAPEVTGGRAYSMVNYDTQTNILSFVIKRKPEGDFSDWLFENNVEGLELEVFGPLGKATFHPEENKNILCIAGGSGIAGMMAIMERGCEESYFSDHKGYVFFGARTAKDMFFVDELTSFVNAYPENLEVTIALSDEGISKELEALHPNIKFDTGFVHTATSEKMAGKFENMMAYVAGPPPMVDGALRMLVVEAKLPGTDIRYDKFG